MIKPLNDYVLLEVEPTEKKVGSIILTTSNDKKSQVARIVAVGEGKMKDGKREPVSLKVGQKVVYRGYSTTECEENDKKYLLIQAEDILAVIE